jgi:hypothetical protein
LQPFLNTTFLKGENNRVQLKIMHNFIPNGFREITLSENMIVSFSLAIAQAQLGEHGQFFFSRLSAVDTFPCIVNQAKKRHLGSAKACQMVDARNRENAPRNYTS